MQGLMQDVPLTLPHLFERAEKLYFDKHITTVTATGREKISYGEWAERTRRLGGVFDDLGISAEGRVATFGWNTARHLELYFAAPCTGRVLHTLNIRLFPEQITYIVNHAEDEVVFVDRSLVALLWPLVPTFETVRHIVVMDDGRGDVPEAADGGPAVHDYEALLSSASPVSFRVDDEDRAAAMAYTSGTTGNPKGVVYSHRSTFLHTMGALTADSLGASERDTILPVVPMFHANAWGLAHAAVACGAKLVMAGPDLTPPTLAGLIESERVTVAARKSVSGRACTWTRTRTNVGGRWNCASQGARRPGFSRLGWMCAWAVPTTASPSATSATSTSMPPAAPRPVFRTKPWTNVQPAWSR